MTNYSVESKSRNEIRELTRAIRKALRKDDELYFPVVQLLDGMSLAFPNFNYEIVEDSELPPYIHADTNILTGEIRIKQSVYDRACNGEGRDRMTIAHEIGHYIMIVCCGFKIARNYNNDIIPAHSDPEWQAKCFAGELLIPGHLVKDLCPEDIAQKCGVSLEAATYQFNLLRKAK